MNLDDLSETATGSFLMIHGWLFSRVLFSFIIVAIFFDVTTFISLFSLVYYWFMYIIIPTIFIGTCLDLASYIREVYKSNGNLAIMIGLNSISSVLLMLILYNIGENKYSEFEAEIVEVEKAHDNELKNKDKEMVSIIKSKHVMERKLYTCNRYVREKVGYNKIHLAKFAPDYIPDDKKDMYDIYVQEGRQDFILELEELYKPKSQ